MDEKLKITQIHEIATESELLNLIFSYMVYRFSYMQLKYFSFFIRKVLKIDRSAFSGTPGIILLETTSGSLVVPIKRLHQHECDMSNGWAGH